MSSAISFESTSHMLSHPGGDLHYHVAGDGPPLILLHGSGPGVSGWANFKGNLAFYAERFRTYIVDMPGYGGSPDVEGHPMNTAQEAVVRFMDAMDLERPDILGNSMGGGVGARVAANHRDRVRRLACIGGVGMPIFNSFPPEGIKLLANFVLEPTRENLVSWMESMVYDRSILTDEFVDERYAQATKTSANESIAKMYSTEGLEAMRARVESPEMISSLEMLARITAPTLITWGRDDRVSPMDMALVPMRVIKNAELHVFPNCGHWTMLERKAEFESVTMAFFTRD